MALKFFKFAGKLLIAQRNATTGKPGVFRYVGNTDEIKFGLATENEEIKESETGQGLTALRLVTGKSATLSFALQQIDEKNLALAGYSAPVSQSSGSVTNETILGTETTLPAVGDFLALDKNVDVSSVVVTDSTGSPKTLTQGTNYRVSNAKAGTLEVLDMTTGAPFVAPLKAAYSKAANTKGVPLFSVTPGNFWVRVEALNVADAGAPALIEFYNVQLNPLSEFDVKSAQAGKLPMSGAPQYDDTKVSDAVLGQFGRVVLF